MIRYSEVCFSFDFFLTDIQKEKAINRSTLASRRLMAPNPGKRSRRDSLFYRISCQKSTMATGGDHIQHYETTDIFIGAFLLCHGGDLSGISFNEKMIATFEIKGVDLHQLDQAYQAGSALVNPVHLRASLNYLRDILFEIKEKRRRDGRKRENTTHQRQR
jgi:hypothetical protein